MYKIAVLDDDRLWCLAIERCLKNDFEVSTFNYADALLQEIIQDIHRYDLIMVDLSLPSEYYKEIDGRKLIRYLRETLPEPPLLVLATAFISKNDLATGQVICPEVDAFLAKDAGLVEIQQQIKQLLNNPKCRA